MIEMNTIYRKVKVSERLPKENGNYIVGYEHGSFQCAYSKEHSFHEEFTDCSIIEWWLEEIELPSEEEIEYESENYESDYVFKDGANFILNKLKEKQKYIRHQHKLAQRHYQRKLFTSKS